MIKFIIKRLLALIPVIIGVTFMVYFIMSLAPGDPALLLLGDDATPEQIAALREEMGLDQPFIIQYGRYMVNLFKGDLGTSYKTKNAVSAEVFSRFPNTLILAGFSTLISIILALPLGVFAAVKQNSLFDTISMVIALLGVSIPIFWFGLLLILLFALKLGWFPVSGFNDGIKSLLLPGLALAFQHMAAIARTTRSSMLETIRQDYIRTVRAKGLPENKVITRHALKNALIPTITVIGLQIGGMMGGSVLTESVFAWPGIGRLMINSIQGRDTPMVLGCILMFSITFSIINLIVDIVYGFVDPRIKAQYK
ncbi:MAG: ABC transporter permease [Lachnospiraceae bacterium]|nr:ABC transporter permease [Lachnospiraceae bacterium]